MYTPGTTIRSLSQLLSADVVFVGNGHPPIPTGDIARCSPWFVYHLLKKGIVREAVPAPETAR